jgi:hypothetical protein
MRQETLNIYIFSELSPEAQECAIKEERDRRQEEGNPFLTEEIKQYLLEKLEEKKIKVINNDLKICYSLSHSQGDGLQFVGWFEWRGQTIQIKPSGHYSHSYCTEISTENKKFIDLYHLICKDAEKFGYEMIEDYESDESIRAFFVDYGDEEFYITGERYY